MQTNSCQAILKQNFVTKHNRSCYSCNTTNKGVLRQTMRGKAYNVYDRSSIPKCKNTGHGRSLWSSAEKCIETSKKGRQQSKGRNKKYSKECSNRYPIVLHKHKQGDGKITQQYNTYKQLQSFLKYYSMVPVKMPSSQICVCKTGLQCLPHNQWAYNLAIAMRKGKDNLFYIPVILVYPH